MLTSYFSDNDGDAVLGQDHFFVTDSRSSVAGLQLSTGSIDVNWQAAACTTSPCPEVSLAGVAPGDQVIVNHTGERDRSSPSSKRKRPQARLSAWGLCNLIPAATYVPTQLPAQYHRPGEA